MGAICPQNAPKSLGSGPRADLCGISLFIWNHRICLCSIGLPVIFPNASRPRHLARELSRTISILTDCSACSAQSSRAIGMVWPETGSVSRVANGICNLQILKMREAPKVPECPNGLANLLQNLFSELVSVEREQRGGPRKDNRSSPRRYCGSWGLKRHAGTGRWKLWKRWA